ncbi:MAG: SGNH/GDSL hydrolase family protein [Nocardioidaceae bacterium]
MSDGPVPARRGPGGRAATIVLTVLAVVAVVVAPGLAQQFFHLSGRAELDTRPVVLVLGDSFESGSLMNRGDAWPDLAGLDHGWVIYVDAEPGTGYVNKGFSALPFPARAKTLVNDYAPDVMIVAGGLDDVLGGYPLQRTLAAADRTFRTLRAGFAARTRLVVLSPFAKGAVPSPAVLALARALRPVAERDGATYVDVTHLLDTHDPALVGWDRTHPTDKGHRLLAHRIADALIARGLLPS